MLLLGGLGGVSIKSIKLILGLLIPILFIVAPNRQCSPNQLKHSINDKIGEDECDHERHSGRTEDANDGYNEPNKVKEKVLLLELRD